jgi:prephenate dehydrogenase
MQVAIIGLGLIGGSIARDLRAREFATRLVGVDARTDHASAATELGLVDEVLALPQAVQQADVVVLAVPVNALQSLAPVVLDHLSQTGTAIDTGSTKTLICKAVARHPKRDQFVAAHPIAGTENSGPTAAVSGLFLGKTNIICEQEKSSAQAIQTANALFDALGMHTVFMQPDEHDRHLAYVSHLSHVSSFLLGQTVLDMEKDKKNIFMLAGSGFSSTVRLAKSSAETWAPIFEQNMEYLSQALQEYIIHLQRFQYHLMKRDTLELTNTMRQANEIRRVLEGLEAKAKPVAETTKTH